MKLQDLKDDWSKDSKIDDSKLSNESLGIAQLHSKYLNVLVDTKQKLIKTKYNILTLRKVKTKYFKGEMTKQELDDYGWEQWQYNKPLKSELADLLDGDTDIADEKVKQEYLETVIYFLESVLGSLRNRSFDIKNAISWNNYLQGN